MFSRVQLLFAFATCMILSGVVMQLPDDGQRFASSSAWLAPGGGNLLIILGACAGALSTRALRRSCNDLAVAVEQPRDHNLDRLLDQSGSSVRRLTRAMNRRLTEARCKVDIAQQRVKELEIQLKVVTAEREHAESIINSISDSVLVTDPWDELVLANESAAGALGFVIPRDGSRRPIDGLLPDAKLVSLIREMRQSKSAGGRRIIEHRVKRGNIESVFKLTLSCLKPVAGSSGGVVAVLQDMTNESEVAKMKNDFVSHVSHELRTPLASIKAYVEMLIDGEAGDSKAQSEFYEIIQTEANRLGRLIDNILNVSRIESGLVKINKVPVSMTIVIKDVLEIIEPQARLKNITIVEQIAPATHQVAADKDMIHQALLNLLSNSVKYTPEGGSITVSTQVDENTGKIMAKIIDTGVGIPEKDLPYVFDKFYRVEANNKMAKGTGLGLSLVKHIVETVHHGKIQVTSTVGKGSCFSMELELC